jgi:hypothetical protein
MGTFVRAAKVLHLFVLRESPRFGGLDTDLLFIGRQREWRCVGSFLGCVGPRFFCKQNSFIARLSHSRGKREVMAQELKIGNTVYLVCEDGKLVRKSDIRDQSVSVPEQDTLKEPELVKG